MKKHKNPQAVSYLTEAKACEKVVKELHRIAEKYQRAVDKEAAQRQSEFENAMEYTSERQIQDDYGWDIIIEAQYERYIDLFRHGKEVLETLPPSVAQISLNIVRHMINDIEQDRQEWEFSALSPQEKAAELERRENANLEWKKRIEEIKKRRGIIATPEKTEDTIC